MSISQGCNVHVMLKEKLHSIFGPILIKGKITIFVAMSIGIYEKAETKQEFSNNCQPKSRDLKMKIKSRDKISFK